ncbi:hypothetical protein DSD19_08345 [Rhodovulum sp. BSW8]|uniref:hypothetical protein n=1 Tax=Rhodovulum sp. BSW8 TaxID=2259645 RepID=UPI000DE1ED01|nr:hypothetical protein [Rhodovulum sp. BSW8]RBO53402.1 hypothetical protein DSD19_08345 [Rhodovulum sp. BSW8]
MEILKDQFKWMLGLVALIGVFGLGYELNKADPDPKAGTEADVAAVADPAADPVAEAVEPVEAATETAAVEAVAETPAEAPAEAAPAETAEAPAQ